MKSVGICGHFGGREIFLDGQTVKTKILTAELCRQLGDGNVLTADTYGGAKKTPLYLWNLGRLLVHCENVVILPAHNAVRIFAPYLTALNHIYKRKLHYVVIGGWLPKLLTSKPRLAAQLKKFDGIYVETTGMMDKLHAMGFANVLLMKNCKDLHILEGNQLRMDFSEPYPVCTFSRVNQKKGIEDAISAIKRVNQTLGRTAYHLDIYGQIEDSYREQFEQLQNSFPEYIRYGGLVPYDKTTEVLKDYYALVFPTHYFTEGIPGSFIDAYAAGVPGVSTRWENWQDVIKDGATGLTFDFEAYNQLEQILLDCAAEPQKLLNLRMNCVKEAEKYLPSRVLKPLVENLC